MARGKKIAQPELPTGKIGKPTRSTNEVLFSFRYLDRRSYPDCKDCSFFHGLLERLRKYSELGWDGIRNSHRHGWGMEKMPVGQIRHAASVPRITPDVEFLHVLRSSGDNRVLVGLQDGQVFDVFFIEAKVGDISQH